MDLLLDLNDNYVEAFNNQTFNQAGNECPILKINFCNPPSLILQRLPVEENVGKVEISSMRKGHIVETLTILDVQEVDKLGEEMIQTYEGVFYRENFKITLFTKDIVKLFALRPKLKDEGNDLMQNLVNLIM